MVIIASMTRLALACQVGSAGIGAQSRYNERHDESAFSSFDSVPIASASIGQVHRARLPDGAEVAVKVPPHGPAGVLAAGGAGCHA